ncbi:MULTISPECIES: amidohydrolase family protein [unclassified Haladaptatus]|uniref:amidohydrolase family protein n=1 Tax=unclassified Haladaptatus TaxID=2622732 RepID=UPI0023E7BDFD|nr:MULTISPECIES: amidohydrolase family protein [unclassified Haladaptatus]
MTFAPATDCHVHLMPDTLMAAIRDALHDAAAWEFDHPTDRESMEAELTEAGVSRYIALPYAHKPGIADDLNDWVLARCADSEMAVPFATVHGDDEVDAVVRRAFENGARGLKFQCPVQGCGPADPRLDPAFELAAEYDRPIMFHAGTAPMFHDNPHVGYDQFAQFVENYPEVRACCAHMGTYEHEAFIECARENEQVFLDTTFAMSAGAQRFMDFDPATIPDSVIEDLAGSIMYGSDYPNIPYPYDDERALLLERDLSDEAFDQLFRGAAERFLG